MTNTPDRQNHVQSEEMVAMNQLLSSDPNDELGPTSNS